MAQDFSDKISLAPHPARISVHGVMVEAFPKYRQVLFNGERAGYVGAPGETGYALTFIREYPDEVREAITSWCIEAGCLPVKVTKPPTLAALERAQADFADDDDGEFEADELV